MPAFPARARAGVSGPGVIPRQARSCGLGSRGQEWQSGKPEELPKWPRNGAGEGKGPLGPTVQIQDGPWPVSPSVYQGQQKHPLHG